MEAKNKFENYAYSVKNSARDASQLSDTDKIAVNKAAEGALSWLERNQAATKDEYEYQYQQLEKEVSPIMVSLHQNSQQSQHPAEPSVEEID